MTAYYNEIEPFAAQWLRNLIAAGHLPVGDVDERSIVEVQPDDVRGYVQCHWFAGLGGWPHAARLAGWPDDRPLWSGSCPCQPFSVAGKGGGQADERHLWPDFYRLIRARRPAFLVGEQVAAAVGKDWLDGVSSDLEGIGYACRAVVVPACAVDAPHRRDRLWFVADRDGMRGQINPDTGGCEDRGGAREITGPCGARDGAVADRNIDGCASRRSAESTARYRHSALAGGGERLALAHADGIIGKRSGTGGASGFSEPADSCDVRHASGAGLPDAEREAGIGVRSGLQGRAVAEPGRASCAGAVEHTGLGRHGDPDETVCSGRDAAVPHDLASAWAGAAWMLGADGKARRVKPYIRLLAHGVPGRVGRLRAYGNAIVPQVAAEVLAAWMDCAP